ncbi:PepSY domain-containing protein [Bosea sp. FBZP-16]|uniref:PepSY domain-containing protein n=1 Tax=Bosea sp. FBZP-16 TaxID=2065382 RepID=UPI00131A1490|nr:PepSY domain-containing protein [Bosea sp. FBZP-16]
MTRLSMLAALLLAVGLAGHASASASAEAKPQNPATATAPKITESQARSIAFRHGLVHIEEIALSDWRWEIAGRAQGGVEVTLDLNAYDGSVVGGAAAP